MSTSSRPIPNVLEFAGDLLSVICNFPNPRITRVKFFDKFFAFLYTHAESHTSPISTPTKKDKIDQGFDVLAFPHHIICLLSKHITRRIIEHLNKILLLRVGTSHSVLKLRVIHFPKVIPFPGYKRTLKITVPFFVRRFRYLLKVRVGT